MDENMSANSFKTHNITLKDRKNMVITGVCEIISFDDVCVSLDISDHILVIDGSGLKIDSFSSDSGDVIMSGLVDSIAYSAKAHETYRKGLLKRIFSYDDK